MRILIVEDDPLFRTELRRMVDELEGVTQVDEAETAEAARAALHATPPPNVVLLDVYMPRTEADRKVNRTSAQGHELAREVRTLVPEARILIVSSIDATEASELLLDAVVDDFLRKDSKAKELRARIARQVAEARKGAADLSRGGLRVGEGGIQEMIGGSAAIQEVRRLLGAAATSRAPVLITGESGSGKELAAWTLHRLSPWARGPFLPFNAASVAEGFVESELFGHKKGAFTGAASNRAGVVESAAGGTLFLDEIGELPTPFQVKLLRFLDTGTFHRLGEDRPRKASVRLVFATNRDLESAVREGSFREDLFYRLNVVRIHLPPLREREEDIPFLARFLANQVASTLGRSPPMLTEPALALLCAHPWPGNVRELRNVVERAMILHPVAVLDASDFSLGLLTTSFGPGAAPTGWLPDPSQPGGTVPDSVPGSAADPDTAGAPPPGSGLGPSPDGPPLQVRYRPGLNLKVTMDAAERAFLEQALAHHRGNVSATARALDVGRRTLQAKMVRLGMR